MTMNKIYATIFWFHNGVQPIISSKHISHVQMIMKSAAGHKQSEWDTQLMLSFSLGDAKNKIMHVLQWWVAGNIFKQI